MRDDALHLYTWGRNRHGVLGHGDDPSASDVVERPRRVLAAPPLLQIAAGEAHCVALTQAGGVVAWGSGLMGALGRGSRASSAAPAEVLPPSASAVAVAAGRHHSLALTARGELLGWGTCGWGGAPRLVPTPEGALGGAAATQIGCGDAFCAALTPSGVWAWGGVFGADGAPSEVLRAAGARQLACAPGGVLVLGAAGELHLALPPPAAPRALALRRPPGERFERIGGGAGFCAALAASGAVYVVAPAPAAALVPIADRRLRGAARFVGAPAHALAVDGGGAVLPLAHAVHESTAAAALPLVRAAGEGAALERTLQATAGALGLRCAQLAVGGAHLALLASAGDAPPPPRSPLYDVDDAPRPLFDFDDDDDEDSSPELKRAGDHRRQRGPAKALGAWAAAADARAASAGRMTRAVGRMRHRPLARGWAAWRYHRAETARRRALLRRGLMRVMRGQFAAAFSGWADAAAERAAVAGCVRRWASRRLARGWRTWAARASSRLAALEHCDARVVAGRRALRRIRTRRGLGRLRAHAAAIAAARMMLARARGHAHGAAVALALLRWRFAVRDGVRGRMRRRFAAAASWSTLVRAAWRRWTATAAMRLREARLMRWRLRGQLLLGLRGWARRGRLLAARRRLHALALRRWRGLSLPGAWARLRAACRAQAAAAAARRSARRALALAAPLAQLRTLALARALGDWRSALPLLALRERCATIEDGLRALRSALAAEQALRRQRHPHSPEPAALAPPYDKRPPLPATPAPPPLRSTPAPLALASSGGGARSVLERVYRLLSVYENARVGPALRGWAYLCLRSRHAPQSPALTARAWV